MLQQQNALANAPVPILVSGDGPAGLMASETWQRLAEGAFEAGHFFPKKEAVHPQDAQAIEHGAQCLAAGEDFGLVYRLNTNLGQRLIWAKGEQTELGYRISATDLTASANILSQNGHAAIADFRYQLEGALQNALTFAIALDPDANITYCNAFFQDVTGWSHQQVLNKSLFEFFLPSLFGSEQAQFTGFLEAFEGQFKTQSGQNTFIRFNPLVFYDQKKQVSWIMLIGEDITEQMKVVQSINDTNYLLSDLFNSTNDLIFMIDEEGDFIYGNEAAKQKLGLSLSDKANLIDVLDEEDIDSTYKTLRMAKETGDSYPWEATFRTPEGNGLLLRGKVSFNSGAQETGLYRAILGDFTDNIKSEKAQRLYYRVAKLVEKNTPITEMYEKLYQELDTAMNIEAFSVLLKKGRGEEIAVPFSVNTALKGSADGLAEFERFAVNTFTKPIAIDRNKLLKICETQQIALYGKLPRTWIGAPLMINERSVGMLVLQYYGDRHKQSDLNMQLLTSISGQLAHVILRFQHEAEIRHQASQLETLFESGNHLMWSVDTKYRLSRFNNNFSDAVWEYYHFAPRLNVPLYRSFDKMGSKKKRLWYRKYHAVFQGEPQRFEISFVGDNGEENWREVYLSPIIGVDGRIDGVSGVAHDITQKKVAELALAESEEKFRNIFESFQDIYFRIDLKGTIIMMSPSVYNHVGESQVEVMGKKITDYLLVEEKLRHLIVQLYEQREVRNFESRIRSKYGEDRIMISNFRLISDSRGRPEYIEGVARDITELKNATEQLRKAKNLAEKSLEVKKRFLSNMSHEIRTPMNGIIGTVDLLLETQLDSEQSDYVSTVKKSSETLLNILNDILDFSKIEEGKMKLRGAPISVRQLIDKLYALFLQQAKVKDTVLVYEIAEDVYDFIEGDETRLLQILSNLTSNAIKFTQDGSVRINVSCASKKEKVQRLRFEVRDTGTGISRQNLGLLFKQFSQVDSTYTKSHGGTGLGLAISQELCHMMGGRIDVESEEGEGSCFWFEVDFPMLPPIEQEAATKKQKLPKKFFKGTPKILLVDDNNVNLSIAGKILRKSGCEIQVSLSGTDAILAVQQHEFDLVFMDIQMPVMNGIEATQAIRELGLKKLPPIVAMTAFSMKEEQEEFLASGMDDFISKPVKAATLLEMVEKWLGARLNSNQNEWANESIKAKEAQEMIIDMATAYELKKFGGDQLLIDAYQEFELETGEMLEQCRFYQRREDYEQVRRILHTIKGNSGTLGLNKLHAHTVKCEGRLKKGVYPQMTADIDQIQHLFDEYKRNYRIILRI